MVQETCNANSDRTSNELVWKIVESKLVYSINDRNTVYIMIESNDRNTVYILILNWYLNKIDKWYSIIGTWETVFGRWYLINGIG